MDLFPIVRPLLFRLEPELSHQLTLKGLGLLKASGLNSLIAQTPSIKPTSAMGLTFPNPIGLAAGLDKNGDYIDALGMLGFGFIEVGTVTPRPQPGNPKPRLFRLPKSNAIINRMGFNNKGIDHLVNRVAQAKFAGVLGVNIGKNFDTPIEKAASDYLACFKKAYPVADYIAINISSPNTQNLRTLQKGSELTTLLEQLKKAQKNLHEQHEKHVPIAIKIAPDLDDEAISDIATIALNIDIEGIIATNTTILRDGIVEPRFKHEAGGLSGAPLVSKATRVVSVLRDVVGDKIDVIGVGGIMNGRDAFYKFNAGAKLVQVYSGLVFKGPSLIQEIANSI